MFSSVLGLLVVGAAFVPRYVYYAARRRIVPMARSTHPLESPPNGATFGGRLDSALS